MSVQETVIPMRRESATPEAEITQVQIIKFPTVDRDITEIRRRYTGLKITDTASYKLVSAALRDVISRRCAVENRRKELNRLTNNEAKRILGLLAPIETELKETKQAYDDRLEKVRKEKEVAEKARVDAIQAKIAQIRAMVPTVPNDSDFLQELAIKIEDLDLQEETYQEFLGEARNAASWALASVEQLLNDRLLWEEEEEARKAEEARLQKVKAEQEAEAARLREIKSQQEAEALRIEKEKEKLAKDAARAARVNCAPARPMKMAVTHESGITLKKSSFLPDNDTDESARTEAKPLLDGGQTADMAVKKPCTEWPDDIAEEYSNAVDPDAAHAAQIDKENLLKFTETLGAITPPDVSTEDGFAIVKRAGVMLAHIQEFIRQEAGHIYRYVSKPGNDIHTSW